MNLKPLCAAVAVAACAFSANANADVLDFEDVLFSSEYRSMYELWGLGSEIYAGSYLLRYAPAPGEPYPTGFQAVSPLWRYNFRDTIAINPNSCSARVTLVAQDNNPFDLLSIDLQELNGVELEPARVTFTGYTTDQQQVTHSVTLNARTDWETVKFPPQFRLLQMVEWYQGDCYGNKPHMFDNIQLEPSHKRGLGPKPK